MKTLLIAALGLIVVPAAQGKDYYIHVRNRLNLVLTTRSCQMNLLTGDGWKYSADKLLTPTGVMTLSPGCWKRVGDNVYVLENASPFSIAPDLSGGKTYYRLDTTGCSFKVPGISLHGWRSGRMIGILNLPKGGFGKVPVIDSGPICWLYRDGWFEQLGKPMVYSASQVKISPLP